jgi:hypothetical protein
MLAARITLAHFSVSPAMERAERAGASIVPKFAKRLDFGIRKSRGNLPAEQVDDLSVLRVGPFTVRASGPYGCRQSGGHKMTWPA